MKTLHKILFIMFVTGCSITLLKMIMEHQIVCFQKPLCNSKPSNINHSIITVEYGGKLGNNIWEYMSVVATIHLYETQLNLTAYIPGCLRARVEYLFERIKIRAVSRIPRFCLKKQPYVLPVNETFQCRKLLKENRCPLILAKYSGRYKDILRYGITNIKKDFRFRKKYVDYSHKIFNDVKTLYNVGQKNVTFVGMHYRGNDYDDFLRQNYNDLVNIRATPNATFYLQAMNYFMQKYETVIFIFITVDWSWLKKNFPLLQRNTAYLIVNPNHNDVARDLVLLSLCNHSIINYGTFGTTSALFAGGTTFVYNLGLPLDQRGSTIAMGIAEILPQWHLLT